MLYHVHRAIDKHCVFPAATGIAAAHKFKNAILLKVVRYPYSSVQKIANVSLKTVALTTRLESSC